MQAPQGCSAKKGVVRMKLDNQTEDTIKRFDLPPLEDLTLLKTKDVGDFELRLVLDTLILNIQGRITYMEALSQCNKILGTHGIEAVAPEGCSYYSDEGIQHCPPFSYCNNGDSYTPTLVRDHEAGKWLVTSWANCLEEVLASR
jgi:hypothetical protein